MLARCDTARRTTRSAIPSLMATRRSVTDCLRLSDRGILPSPADPTRRPLLESEPDEAGIPTRWLPVRAGQNALQPGPGRQAEPPGVPDERPAARVLAVQQ